jgi:hypothetical protein
VAKLFGWIVLAAVVGAGPAAAGERAPGHAAAIGKVKDFYVRLARHVFLERASGLVPRGELPDFWVDLELAGDASQGRQFALARLGDVGGVELGDLVEVDFADIDLRAAARMRRGVAPLARQDRVLAIAAKHFTPLARQFGRSARAAAAPRLDLSQRGHVF